MSEIVAGAVDCDVHIFPESTESLYPYLDPYWQWYIRNGSLRIASYYPPDRPLSARQEARDSGSFPPNNVDALRTQLLDPHDTQYAILNCLTGLYEASNPYYQEALAKAINDWVRTEWLDQDERLRASIIVPSLYPEAAAAEIDRLSEDPRFVQVMLPIRSETPWGNVRWSPIHAAAACHDLPIAFHAWGGFKLAATMTGYGDNYFDDTLFNSHFIPSAQVMSLVLEGVFDRYPNLRILLSECGFSWLPSIMWRFDKDWNGAWRETPWLKERPSSYVKKHFKATTAPLQLADVSPVRVSRLADMVGAKNLLMYASDYPHDHGDDGIETLFNVLGDEGTEAVLRGNASDFYRLAPA